MSSEPVTVTPLRARKARLNKLNRFLLRIIIQFLNYNEMFLLFKLNRIFTKCMEINANVWSIFKYLKAYDLKEKTLTMDEIILQVNEKFPNCRENDLVNSLFLKTKKDFEKNNEYVFVFKEEKNFDALNNICNDFHHYYFGQRDYSLKLLDKENLIQVVDRKDAIPKLINKLVLRGLGLSEDECCGVIRSLSDRISKFDLGGNAIDSCVSIAEILKDNKLEIKDISLFGNKLTNKAFEALSEGVAMNYTLKALDVSNNEAATNIACLIEAIKNMEISQLNLSIISFAADHMGPSLTAIYDYVKLNPFLRSLNLSHCGLNDNGLTLLCGCLSVNKTLTSLQLNHNMIAFDINTEGLEIIKSALTQNHTVKYLDLSNNKITGLKNLGECLQHNRGIETLMMNFVTMTDKFQGLGSGLVNNTVISDIEFGFCGLSDEDAKSLCEIILTCKRLKKLGLRKNYLFVESGRLFAEALEKNDVLTHFEISWNNIRDEGVNFLKSSLSQNRTVEYLDLRSNYITEKGCAAIYQILSENKHIKKIDLSYNNISDDYYLANMANFKRIRFFYIPT